MLGDFVKKILVCAVFILITNPVLATLVEVVPEETGSEPGQDQVCVNTDYIAWDNIGGMVTSSFIPESSYSFSFAYGSKDISDGSDFESVRRAFGTWIDLPSSSIFASERALSGEPSFSPGNGQNEISWVGYDREGVDIWHDVLEFSSSTIAVVMTWYIEQTGKVVERDMYFNDVDMSWFTDTDGVVNGFYVEHIALHEVGHIYGLKDIYNPGQPGYEEWMGEGNSSLAMYGYSHPANMGITLTAVDIEAMALAHPASLPEPRTAMLFGLMGGLIVVRTERCRR